MMHPSLQTIREEHDAIRTVLQSLATLVERGPEDEPVGFFDAVRAMLFYLEEFPERLHHANESALLFPKVARVAPELAEVVRRLDSEHDDGIAQLRRLHSLVLAWELLGEPRHAPAAAAVQDHVRSCLEHMQLEEIQVLPAAQRLFSDQDWVELDDAFRRARDPLAGGTAAPMYDRLLSRISLIAPACVAGAIQHAMPHRAR